MQRCFRVPACRAARTLRVNGRIRRRCIRKRRPRFGQIAWSPRGRRQWSSVGTVHRGQGSIALLAAHRSRGTVICILCASTRLHCGTFICFWSHHFLNFSNEVVHTRPCAAACARGRLHRGERGCLVIQEPAGDQDGNETRMRKLTWIGVHTSKFFL